MNRFCLAALVALLGILSTARAFEITRSVEQIPESNPVTRVHIADEGVRFSFIPVATWVLKSDAAAKRLSIQQSTGQGIVTVQLSTNTVPAGAGSLESRVKADYTDAKVLTEIQAFTATGVVPGIEFEHTIAGRFRYTTRLAIFPTHNGSLEVSLSFPTTNAQDLHPIWTGFMNSFRMEPVEAKK